MEQEMLVSAPWSLVGHGNVTKQQGSFRLEVKNFFAVSVVKHWNRFPSEVSDAPCPSVFKSHLDNALYNML